MRAAWLWMGASSVSVVLAACGDDVSDDVASRAPGWRAVPSVDDAGHEASVGYDAGCEWDCEPSLAVAGFDHVYVTPAGTYVADDWQEQISLWQTAAPVPFTCTCPASYVSERAFDVHGDVGCDGGGISIGASCDALYVDDDGGTFAPYYPGKFDAIDVHAPASGDSILSGYLSDQDASVRTLETNVWVWSPLFVGDRAPAGAIDCELATGDVTCPTDYATKTVLHDLEDSRSCECAATFTTSAPKLELYATLDCTSAATAVYPLTDGTCAPILMPSDTKGAAVLAHEEVTVSDTPSYSGTFETHPHTLCCP